MLGRSLALAGILRSGSRRFSSTSSCFVGLEQEFSQVEHTPIFSQALSKLLLQDGSDEKLILDMTFGSGGHTSLLLEHEPCKVQRVVACDCDGVAYNEAKEMEARHPNKLIPVKAHFHELIPFLLDMGFSPGSFDGIIIDTGCSSFQWSDPSKGFCPTRSGLLDLRYIDDPNVPTASEVLQHIKDRDLFKLIKAYSDLGPNKAKYVANAIVEARYMFHKFQTTQELYDVLKSAAADYCRDQLSSLEFNRQRTYTESKFKVPSEKEVGKAMILQTVTALKHFVNNDVNEIHFAINEVAKNFLKPVSGVLVAIVSSDAERRVVETSLQEADQQVYADTALLLNRTWLPWTVLKPFPQELTAAERTLNPRHFSAKLYAASLNGN